MNKTTRVGLILCFFGLMLLSIFLPNTGWLPNSIGLRLAGFCSGIAFLFWYLGFKREANKKS